MIHFGANQGFLLQESALKKKSSIYEQMCINKKKKCGFTQPHGMMTLDPDFAAASLSCLDLPLYSLIIFVCIVLILYSLYLCLMFGVLWFNLNVTIKHSLQWYIYLFIDNEHVRVLSNEWCVDTGMYEVCRVASR